MTRAEVQRLIRAKWGKKGHAVENKNALDPETRAIIRAELERVKAAEPVKPLEVIAWEQRWREWNMQRKVLNDKLLWRRRCLIEEDYGIGSRIHGNGDTWEEAARQANLIPKEGDST